MNQFNFDPNSLNYDINKVSMRDNFSTSAEFHLFPPRSQEFDSVYTPITEPNTQLSRVGSEIFRDDIGLNLFSNHSNVDLNLTRKNSPSEDDTTLVVGPIYSLDKFQELISILKEKCLNTRIHFSQKDACGFIYFPTKLACSRCELFLNGYSFCGETLRACPPSKFLGQNSSPEIRVTELIKKPQPKSEPATLVVYNLSFSLSQDKFVSFLTSLRIFPKEVEFQVEHGCFRGVAFVTFGSSKQATDALEQLQNKEVSNRTIKVEFSRRGCSRVSSALESAGDREAERRQLWPRSVSDPSSFDDVEIESGIMNNFAAAVAAAGGIHTSIVKSLNRSRNSFAPIQSSSSLSSSPSPPSSEIPNKSQKLKSSRIISSITSSLSSSQPSPPSSPQSPPSPPLSSEANIAQEMISSISISSSSSSSSSSSHHHSQNQNQINSNNNSKAALNIQNHANQQSFVNPTRSQQSYHYPRSTTHQTNNNNNNNNNNSNNASGYQVHSSSGNNNNNSNYNNNNNSTSLSSSSSLSSKSSSQHSPPPPIVPQGFSLNSLLSGDAPFNPKLVPGLEFTKVQIHKGKRASSKK